MSCNSIFKDEYVGPGYKKNFKFRFMLYESGKRTEKDNCGETFFYINIIIQIAEAEKGHYDAEAKLMCNIIYWQAQQFILLYDLNSITFILP